MKDRKIYLNKITIEEAKQRIYHAIQAGKITWKGKNEMLPVEDSLERITSEAVYARRSSLHYTASAMDGIAVHSRDTVNASEKYPVTLTHEKDFIYMNTGHPLPEEFDAVIKIEDVVPAAEQEQDEQSVIQDSHACSMNNIMGRATIISPITKTPSSLMFFFPE